VLSGKNVLNQYMVKKASDLEENLENEEGLVFPIINRKRGELVCTVQINIQFKNNEDRSKLDSALKFLSERMLGIYYRLIEP
jgi:iron-sulfur cluster repair protein YtfE (RIC family)